MSQFKNKVLIYLDHEGHKVPIAIGIHQEYNVVPAVVLGVLSDPYILDEA